MAKIIKANGLLGRRVFMSDKGTKIMVRAWLKDLKFSRVAREGIKRLLMFKIHLWHKPNLNKISQSFNYEKRIMSNK